MGLGVEEMRRVVCGLTATNFYKSMTTYHDARLWQDVYHAPTPAGEAYIKITSYADDRPPIIQFKGR